MSTPMQTNTEELLEILQQVYDLPEAGSGGSAEPDLVLSLTLPDSKNLSSMDVSEVSIKSGSVANTYAKLQNREEVKVFAEHDYYYGGVCKFTGVFYPSVISRANLEGLECLAVSFVASNFPGGAYTGKHVYILLGLDESIMDAGTTNI